jgi:thioredoxin reductase/NAD-dependent dihydropyrimidine dehydrogenase PreA subunit
MDWHALPPQWTWFAAATGLGALVYTAHHMAQRNEAARDALGRAQLKDMEGLGETVPTTLHPHIDPARCIGSGACVRACPEHDVLQIVGGVARLVNPLGCVGHGACAAACGVEAIRLVFGTATRGVELPRITEHFESTSADGVFIVGELSGMGLIRNAVRQGSQAGEYIGKSKRTAVNGALHAIVVGAGPAGIAAALALRQAGKDFIVLDRESFGGTIMHYPRGKVVMAGDLELPGYGRVKKGRMSKEELVTLWKDILQKTQLPVKTGALVTGLSREPDGMWRVQSSAGKARAAHVILALGRRGSPRKLEIPGEESQKVSYRVIEPEEHQGKHVMVVGGGNSAVETAVILADYGGCASVSISYRKGKFARARAENMQRIEEALKSGQVRGYLDTELTSIEADKVHLKYNDGRVETVRNDSVVVQVGGTDPGELLASFGIELAKKFGDV